MPRRSTLQDKNDARPRRTRFRTPALGALAAALTLPASAGAAGTPAPVTEEAGPYMPLAAQPEVGDGLGADRGHEGADLFAATGTDLIAVADGVVVEAGTDGGRGNYVSIFSPSLGNTFNYFHMLEPALVGTGEKVRAGQTLGYLGCTGSCYGAHLHFEVRDGRSPYAPVVDPLPLLDGLEQAPAGAPTTGAEIPSAIVSPALP